jgi:hypothetical protein
MFKIKNMKEKRVGMKIKSSKYEEVKSWLTKEMGENWCEGRSAAENMEFYIEKVRAKFEGINQKEFFATCEEKKKKLTQELNEI